MEMRNIIDCISIINQKGGVSKTTTAINLSAGLKEHNYKVLLIDFDAQANSTNGMGINDEDLKYSIFDLITNEKLTIDDINKTIIHTSYEIDVIPSNIDLANAEILLTNAISRELKLRRVVTLIKDFYDFIIIDCPPSLGLLSINALVACTKAIIPVNASFFSLKGLKHLLNTIDIVKEININLMLLGILVTKYTKRTNIEKSIKNILEENFKDKIFDTVIRSSVQVEYSQDSMEPLLFYNKNNNVSEDYKNFTMEVIEKCQRKS